MNPTDTQPASTDRFARTAIVATVAFVALLGLLHVVKSQLDPSWHFISEYAIGTHGWIMITAFSSLAVAYVALAGALRPHLGGRIGLLGRLSLYVSALGLLIAAAFVTDPVTATNHTVHGVLHNVGGTLGIAMPIAAGIIGWRLSTQPAWRAHRRSLRVISLVAVFASVAAAASIAMTAAARGNTFGPDVHIGWPNRLDILASCGWLLATARATIDVARHAPPSGRRATTARPRARHLVSQ